MTRTARDISVLVACAAMLVGCGSGDEGSDSGGPSGAASSSASGSPAPSADASSSDGTPVPSGSPAADETSAASPSISDATGGAEVPSVDPDDTGLPEPTTPADPTGPYVTRPLPPGGTREGGLVAGYPADVLPPATGSTVDISSVSPSGRQLQVSLTARSSRGAATVLQFYRKHLAGLGLKETKVPVASTATAAAFRRGRDTVTVTVQATSDGSSYSVFANLYAG